jgi:glycosyltransferase involved in cell wall biosynthesis
MVKEQVPELQAVIVGEGSMRAALEAQRSELGADSWIDLSGHQGDDELVDTYRRAWVLTSSSAREGWGMTVTEAARCGTPAVVSDIAGHRDAVVDGVTGILAQGDDELASALTKVVVDGDLRRTLGQAAERHAEQFTWERTALGTMAALVASVKRRSKS